jgi:hypothetical protein
MSRSFRGLYLAKEGAPVTRLLLPPKTFSEQHIEYMQHGGVNLWSDE